MTLIYTIPKAEYIQQLLFGGFEKYEQINKLSII